MKNKKLQEMSNTELWALFPIVLSAYKPEWVQYYQQEKEVLEKVLSESIGADAIVRISHIGSTSVAGLVAKPTIDILLKIKEDVNVGKLIKTLEDAEYIFNKDSNTHPLHMMFMKGYTLKGFADQVYHLHVRHQGDCDELYFRDYLRAHPEVAAEYVALKKDLALQYQHNRDAYTDAKIKFIKKYTKLAKL